MKRKLFLFLCALLTSVGMWAQWTDVTSTYITNPSFELGTNGTPAASAASGAFDAPYSWVATDMPTSGTHDFGNFKNDGNTPSNFGKEVAPSDGTYYYLARHSWASSLTTKLSQTSTLPAGVYFLDIDYKIAKTSGDLNPKGYLTLGVKKGDTQLGSSNSAISASQNGTYFNTAAWTTLRVPFYVDSEGSVDFIITFNFNPESANIPQEAIIVDNVRLLKANNPAEPVGSGTTDLYLYNEDGGLYLSEGLDWGTRGILSNYGQEMTATFSNGYYTLKTQQYNNKYFGSDLHLDNGTAGKWYFLETSSGSGKYYITLDEKNYLTSNGAGASLSKEATPTDASVWTVISKADRKTALSSATIDVPGDATFLIADANFSRECISTPWNGSSEQEGGAQNLNMSGGTNENRCAESYHAHFSIHQNLSGMPTGVYGLTAQGFYRQDGSGNELAYFYLNSEKEYFPLRTGSENNMSDASNSFSAGLYTIEPIYVRVENGNIELGAKCDDHYNLWCIWDNFQLKYYGDVTVAAVKMKASVDAYNAAMSEATAFTEASMWASDWTALQTAITTNTVDLNDPDLTEEELNAATANLVAANTAASAAVTVKVTYDLAVSTIDGGTNVDLTNLLTNPGFETGNTTGWTNSGAISANAQGNKAFDNVQGNYYAERWHANGTIDINQTVAALPVGIYRVDAYMYSDVADAQLYANSENVSVSTSKKYQVVVEIADKASLKIGASCTLTNSTWICMDAFTLTYLADSYANIPYTLATGKMGTDKAAAQTAAETAFLANPNKSTYEALLSAIAEAEASVGNYATLKTAIDKAQAVKDANNFVTAAATTALGNEISTATTAWTNVTYTDEECNTEIATLGSTASGWRAIGSEGMAGAYIASTWGKTSENWWTDFYINTWSTEGDNDGTGFSVPFFEYFANADQNLPANTFTATLTGLDNGMYEVEIWARAQRRTDADFNGDNTMITMFVNGGDAVSIMNGSNIEGYDATHTMRLGRFAARGEVTNGTLTLSIDVKLGSNVHWLSWRDVKYTKLDEANMAVNATAQWGTFCAPFAVEIPSGVTAYTCESAPDGVLELTPQDSPIPANTPVILNAESGLSSTMFYGKKEGNEDIVNYGMLYGNVSTEAKNVPSDGSAYLLQRNNNKTGFYQVTGTGYKIGYNRCYLVESGEITAREAFFFEDEGETAINEIEAVEAKAKGLKDGKYLINGRIVVVNNGRAFGANGQILK